MDLSKLSEAQLLQLKASYERQITLSGRIEAISQDFFKMAKAGTFDARYLDIAHNAIMQIEPLNFETETMRDDICKTIAQIRENTKERRYR